MFDLRNLPVENPAQGSHPAGFVEFIGQVPSNIIGDICNVNVIL